MTGGWRPFKDDEFPPIVLRALARTADEAEVDALLARLHDAARFKRAVMRLLRGQGVNFVEWRVLRATQQALQATGDAVSQELVARYAAMDFGSVQKGVRRLERRGLVDISFDQWGWSQRIWMSATGTELLQRIEPLVAGIG